jgi:hypothetical protein
VLLQFFPDSGNLIVAAADSGLTGQPDWYLNLKAHPQAHAEVKGSTVDVRAEAAALWPRVLASAPDGARYPRQANQAIPAPAACPATRQP